VRGDQMANARDDVALIRMPRFIAAKHVEQRSAMHLADDRGWRLISQGEVETISREEDNAGAAAKRRDR
jgi:hypothetical protein